MQATDFNPLVDRVLTELRTGLSSHLTYHSVQHTLDVMEQANAIANREVVQDASDFLLIKLAALYHDTGFLEVYKGHEEVSCRKATRELTAAGVSDAAIECICGMIMATKIPQKPRNLLEQILADADLDYLGRTDFFSISNKLRSEFIYYNIVETEPAFNTLQIQFLESHSYFTASSRSLRTPVKQLHYETLIQQHHNGLNNQNV
jgi:uncharacterized protein